MLVQLLHHERRRRRFHSMICICMSWLLPSTVQNIGPCMRSEHTSNYLARQYSYRLSDTICISHFTNFAMTIVIGERVHDFGPASSPEYLHAERTLS